MERRGPKALSQHATLLMQRIALGTAEVDFSRREIRLGPNSDAQRMTDKARLVLAVLVAAKGAVVTREQLMQDVWTDSITTNDVLNQAIASLRRLLKDDAEQPGYIETISRIGYRLVARAEVIQTHCQIALTTEPIAGDLPSIPVVVREASTQHAEGVSDRLTWDKDSDRARWSRALVWTTLAASLLSLLWFGARNHGPSETSSTRSAGATQVIASSAAAEYQPRLSPEANQVVYIRNQLSGELTELVLQSARVGGAERVLYQARFGELRSPLWLPDASAILLEEFDEAQARCELLSVSTINTQVETIGHCAASVVPGGLSDVRSDGKRLLGSHFQAGTRFLAEFDLDEQDWQHIRYSPDAAGLDRYAIYAPDGESIFFVRGLANADIWQVPLKGGKAIKRTDVQAEIAGLSLNSQGDAVLFGQVHNGQFQIRALHLSNGLVSSLPQQGIYPHQVSGKPWMVYGMVASRPSIWALPKHGAPVRRFASTGADRSVTVAPDGRSVAFFSSRGGSYGLWVADLSDSNGENAQLVDDLVPRLGFSASFSDDSASIWLVAEGERESSEIVCVARGSLRIQQRLQAPDGINWVRPMRADKLLIGWRERGQEWLGLARIDGSRLAVQKRLPGISHAMFDPVANRVVASRSGSPGLVTLAADLSDQRVRLADHPSPRFYSRWGITRSGMLFYPEATPHIQLRRVWPDSDKAETPGLVTAWLEIQSAWPLDQEGWLVTQSGELILDVGLVALP